MDLAKIWARLFNWGTMALAVGAAITLLSGKIASREPEETRGRVDLICKLAGLVIAVIGALRILGYIRDI